MAIKPINYEGGLGNVTTENNENQLKICAICAVDSDGYIRGDAAANFLIKPSTLQDTKSSNWVQQQVPGQSDPVLQWTSSGPRILSFQALVTRDTSKYVSGQVNQPGTQDKKEKIQTIFSKIAAKFAKTTTLIPKLDDSSNVAPLDISYILDYYRSFLYPTYDEGTYSLTASPPLVVLYMGNSIAKVPYGEKITTQNDVWVVTNLDIQITKFLPNLAPMEAVVSFQLTQYNIRSFDRFRFLK